MIFPIEVNLYNNTHIIVIDNIKFDLICLLGIEDKNHIKDDFFINKCFGNIITKEELIIEPTFNLGKTYEVIDKNKWISKLENKSLQKKTIQFIEKYKKYKLLL